MPAGRPPNLFSSEELIDLGKDLLAWMDSSEGKNVIIWVDWYHYRHGMFRTDWKALIQREEFLPYYDLARQKMAQNISLNNKIAQSYGNRYLHRYDDELGADEETARDREAKRGQEMQNNVNLDQLNVLASCLSKFSRPDLISVHIVDEENRNE